MTGDFAALNLLIKRIESIPGSTPEMVAELVPTARALIHSASSADVPPRSVGWAKRKGIVDPATQARIDAKVVVEAEGTLIVSTAGGGLNVEHDRPFLPVGEIPPKWRRALFAKANGFIRRRLGLTEATAFLEKSLAPGPALVSRLREAAKAAGIRQGDLKRARERLGVIRGGRGVALPGWARR